MGLKRVMCSGCAGMLCLIPMAWISFNFFGLTSAVTGGIIENLSSGLSAIGALLGPLGEILVIAAGAFIGIILLFLFPLHWGLFYRPDDVGLLIAIVVPWILCCTITAGLFAHSPRGGINTSLAIGIGWAIPILIIVFAVPTILGAISPIAGGIAWGLINGLGTGLTDLPLFFAILLAIFEGAGVGALFGALIGALKYKPGEEQETRKVKRARGKARKKKEKAYIPEPTIGSPASTTSAPTKKVDFCTNCGAKRVGSSEFCTNCGAAFK